MVNKVPALANSIDKNVPVENSARSMLEKPRDDTSPAGRFVVMTENLEDKGDPDFSLKAC